jgi:hypothetical protein
MAEEGKSAGGCNISVRISENPPEGIPTLT